MTISDSASGSDIYFNYVFCNELGTVRNIKIYCPTIFFMYSGELIIKHENEELSVRKGECIFFQTDITVALHSKSYENESFCGIYFRFNKSFLVNFYNNYYSHHIIPKKSNFSVTILKIECTPYMQSLYISMIPYLKQKSRPDKNVLELKRTECIYCMLTSDARFYSSLFSFIKPKEQNFFYIINKDNLN